MSGVALKISTLLIRTVSKPIAQRIKHQAREHEGFRRICVGWAQLIHRVDMRLRLGLLQDPAALERQAQREAAEAAKRKRIAEAPTVKTEAEAKAEEEAAKQELKDGVKKIKDKEKSKIKPLSEAKAIDLGSNFIAESFLFAVAVGTVVFETWRNRRKEKGRRDGVAEQLEALRERDEEKGRRIAELEAEIRGLRGENGWHWPWQKGQGESFEEWKARVVREGLQEEGRLREAVEKRGGEMREREGKAGVAGDEKLGEVEIRQEVSKAEAVKKTAGSSEAASKTTQEPTQPVRSPAEAPALRRSEK